MIDLNSGSGFVYGGALSTVTSPAYRINVLIDGALVPEQVAVVADAPPSIASNRPSMGPLPATPSSPSDGFHGAG